MIFRFLVSTRGKQNHAGLTIMTETKNRPAYDFPTAVTFLFAGLGLGWILAFLLSPLAGNPPLSRPSSRSRSVADEVFSR